MTRAGLLRRPRGPGGALALGAVVIPRGGAARLALATGGRAVALSLGVTPLLLADGLVVVGAPLIAARERSRTLGPV